MDRRYIRDNQVIERYLKGTLTADEERAFEELYLGDPDLLDEIELVDGLARLRMSGPPAESNGPVAAHGSARH